MLPLKSQILNFDEAASFYLRRSKSPITASSLLVKYSVA